MQVFAVLDSVPSFLMMLMLVQILAYAGASHPVRLEGAQVCSLDCDTSNETTPEISAKLLIMGEIPSRI